MTEVPPVFEENRNFGFWRNLTFTFRRAVSETMWRWPLFVVVTLMAIHLFLPEPLQKYDPLDRLYLRFGPEAPSQPTDSPEPPHTVPPDPSRQPAQ